ncbi:MAG: NAD(P)/FAD-dependent oxidoreductase [Ignavibacteria bacterium]
MRDPEYDWIIVGAGAAGISIAEMLSRMGLSVLLLERNATLAAETSRIFHEWLHTGTLYTLVPDRLKTTRYLLGAIDDLLEYYSGFDRMNLLATEAGLRVGNMGWFNDEHIHYRYRARPLNPIWSMAVARSLWLIDDIDRHDWLRRRAGALHDGFRFNLPKILRKYPMARSGFTTVRSPDVTINSRSLLSDLLGAYEGSGNRVITGCAVEEIDDRGSHVRVRTDAGDFVGRRAVICAADGIAKFTRLDVKISHAPMFVVEGLDEKTQSFVELDYFVKSCINLLNKGNGYGLAGGISVEREDQIQEYFEYCVNLHRQRNPGIRVLDMYVGHKKELVGKGQERNYLYHINEVSPNVWGVVLGKFTLMFSLAPEFVRRAYHRNPPRSASVRPGPTSTRHPKLSNPRWFDIVLESEK